MIAMFTGTEGPRHDPYGFETRVVSRGDSVIILHEGLDQYLQTITPGMGVVELRADYPALRQAFAEISGMTVQTFDRAIDRLRTQCRTCGCRRPHPVKGMPGETLWLCSRCERPVYCDFDPSCIE